MDYPHMQESYLSRYGKRKEDGGDGAIDFLAGQTTYVELLNKNGYNCAHSGKWHLGDNVNAKPGFNSGYFTIGSGGCGYFSADVHEGGKSEIHGGYITDLITDKALEYMRGMYRDPEGRPFYASVHFTAPHSPWDANNHKPEHLEIYSGSSFPFTPLKKIHPRQIISAPIGDDDARRREHLTGYYASITAMDECVGRIVSDLKENGKYDDTIIIFTSDNGMNLGQHGIWGKGNGTYPQNMYDSSVKVPFIASCPKLFCNGRSAEGTSSSGRLFDGLACQYDIFHTLLELAGAAYVREAKQPGRSLAPILTGNVTEAPAELPYGEASGGAVCIYDEYGQVRMIRTNKYKYIHYYMHENSAEVSLPDKTNCELFDLAADPEEETNVINFAAYAGAAEELRGRMAAFFDEYGTDRFDGKKCFVSGRGQMDYADKAGAFNPEYTYYYPEKNMR